MGIYYTWVHLTRLNWSFATKLVVVDEPRHFCFIKLVVGDRLCRPRQTLSSATQLVVSDERQFCLSRTKGTKYFIVFFSSRFEEESVECAGNQ